MKSSVYSLLAIGVMTLTIGAPADAACISPDGHSKSSLAHNILAPRILGAAPSSALGTDGSAGTIVGLWATTFLVGDGPMIWDQAFEQWHSDGTELAVDNAVPPLLGNVCVGVWKQTGHAISLRHVTWNWNLDGTKAGTFVLFMTATVGRGGDTFSGTYVTDSYDLNGDVIPELHAEGVVRGQRITVD